MNYSEFIYDVLSQASFLANNYFGKVSGVTKKDDNNQVLTQADLEIGKFLGNKVIEIFPQYNVIDEEAGVIDQGADLTWVIDPIDGTSNFANGIPTYGIYIGLLQKNTPIAGGVALPSFQKIYTAEKGAGCFCNKLLVTVSSEKNLAQSLVAYQMDGHPESPENTRKELEIFGRILPAIRNERTSNSAFDCAMVIEGRYGALLNQSSKIWDNVAQQILIEEAGGIYTDFFGKSIDYSFPLKRSNENFTYCAGSPLLYQQLQSLIHQE